MEYEEKFAFVFDCLLKFDYPQLITSDVDSLRDIFKKENRAFFVSWFLKKLDSDYEAITENATSKKLADILESLGFCTKLNKDLFMMGEVDGVADISIVYTMFKFLDDVENSSETELDPNVTTINVIDSYLTSDINLFSRMGAKNTLSLEDKRKKIVEYEQEIEKLKEAQLNNNKNLLPNLDILSLQEPLIKAMNLFEQKHPLFVQNVNTLLLQEQLQPLQDTVCFQPTFAEAARECANESTNILQFLDNSRNIESFIGRAQSVNEELGEIVQRGKNHTSMIRQISDMLSETTGKME